MLVSVASVKGSPGVTTFSTALAACWPASRRVVVEADASGGDLVTRFALPTTGVVGLAAEVRAGSADGEAVFRHAHRIGDGVQVVAAPPGAAEAAGALQAMTPGVVRVLRACAADPETAVIVDCGRLDPGMSPVSMVGGADVLLVLAGAQADDLAHLPSRLASLGRGCRQRRLLLVGAGYPTSEVERELGVAVASRIPWDPRAAAALRGLGPPRRRSRLVKAAERVARSLLAAHPEGTSGPREPDPPHAMSLASWSVPQVSWANEARKAVASGNGSGDGPAGSSSAGETTT